MEENRPQECNRQGIAPSLLPTVKTVTNNMVIQSRSRERMIEESKLSALHLRFKDLISMNKRQLSLQASS
jgi:hypothetical protein